MTILLLISGEQEARAYAEENGLGLWGKWATRGIRQIHNQRRPEGRPRGSEGRAERSEGRIWASLLVALGLELVVGLSSLGVASTLSRCGHLHPHCIDIPIVEGSGRFQCYRAWSLGQDLYNKVSLQYLHSPIMLRPFPAPSLPL